MSYAGHVIACPATGRKARQNVWDNWVGYLNGRKVEEFGSGLDGERRAREWVEDESAPENRQLRDDSECQDGCQCNACERDDPIEATQDVGHVRNIFGGPLSPGVYRLTGRGADALLERAPELSQRYPIPDTHFLKRQAE